MEDIREGALHKTVVIGDAVFEIRYGYASDEERQHWEPTPIYPDFVTMPRYTPEGFSFVTAYQDGCIHYQGKPMATGENWCSDCKHFEACEEYIGICRCDKRAQHSASAPKADA